MYARDELEEIFVEVFTEYEGWQPDRNTNPYQMFQYIVSKYVELEENCMEMSDTLREFDPELCEDLVTEEACESFSANNYVTE